MAFLSQGLLVSALRCAMKVTFPLSLHPYFCSSTLLPPLSPRTQHPTSRTLAPPQGPGWICGTVLFLHICASHNVYTVCVGKAAREQSSSRSFSPLVRVYTVGLRHSFVYRSSALWHCLESKTITAVICMKWNKLDFKCKNTCCYVVCVDSCID